MLILMKYLIKIQIYLRKFVRMKRAKKRESLFMPINEVARKLEITRATELKWRKSGFLPEPV